MMPDKKELVLLFSGGVDSTYTAVLMQDKYDKIHLVTYDRFGLLYTENSRNSALQLKEKFGEDKFIHKIINIDNLFKKVAYSNYLRDILKYKFFLLLTCGLCKLAMHWQTVIYCLDNNIKEACDGSNQEMLSDPSQNAVIIEEMKRFFEGFGISYFNPVFYEPRAIREKALFNLGLTPIQQPKWTRFSAERQALCTQEYLSFKFFDYACSDWGRKITAERVKRYEKRMREYHQTKRDFIKQEIYEYLKNRARD